MTETAIRHLPSDKVFEGDKVCGDYVLIDVRTPAEFAEMHIDGAINVPLGDLQTLMPTLAGEVSGKDIVLVCRSGQRAQKATALINRPDAGDVFVLDGGIAAWDAKGLPLARGRTAISIERQVRIAAGALVLAGSLLATFVWYGFWVLPAFVGAGLAFAGLTDFCGMAILLAKMPWNRVKHGAASPTRAPSSLGGCCGK